MVRDLVFTHGIMPRDWTGFESAQAFLTGDLAMGWFISPGISYSREYLPWELGISHIPRFNGERHALLYGTVLVNFARGRKNRRRAMDFMLGLVSRENDIRMFEQVGFVPVRESSRSSLQVRAFVKNNPVFGVPIEALEYARALPPHPRFQKIDREIAAMLERIILGGASPSGELARTQAILDEIVGGD
jgi:ABC-type glycerol-3-phosphate transport system substrate-binding protein